jgi:hypothetical protein
MPDAKRETMTPIKSAALLAIAAVSVIAPSATPARAQTYPIECAQRDVQVVTQLEQYGEAQAAPGEILYEAFWILTRARQVCSEGRAVAALALYDSIFKTSLTGRKQTH